MMKYITIIIKLEMCKLKQGNNMIYLNCNGKRGNTKNILMVEMVVGLQILAIKDNVTFKRKIY